MKQLGFFVFCLYMFILNTQNNKLFAQLTVNANPGTTVCAGTAVTLTASGIVGATYSWSPGGATTSSITVSPTNTTTYTCTAIANSISYTANTSITVNPIPTGIITANMFGSLSVSSSLPLCCYLWSTGATTSNITVMGSGTYCVVITSLQGCNSAPICIPSWAFPSLYYFNAGNNATISCIQNSNGLQIGAPTTVGHTYSWSPTLGLSNPTISNPFANPTVTTTYTLTETDVNGNQLVDQITITVDKTPPTANAGLDFTKTCASNSTGATIGTTAVSGNTYAWTPTNGLSSATIANPTANPLFNTTYTLTATNTGNGCTATDQVIVTVNTFQPTANAGVDFTKTCISNVNGLTIGSTSVTGNTYAWTPTTGLSSATVSNPTANPTTTTTYTLTTTNTASGCTATDQVLVTVDNQGPTVNAGIDLSKTCVSNVNGATIGMTAIAGNSYTWTPATGLSSTTIANPFANPTVTTTYTVSSTNPTTGCTATDQIVVTVNNTPPTANAGLDATVSCNTNVGGALLGTPTVPGNTYAWTPSTGLNSSTLSQPMANPAANITNKLPVTTKDRKGVG